MSRPITISNN